MKIKSILILAFVFTNLLYAQSDSVNCKKMRDSLDIFYSRDYFFQKLPQIIGGLDSLSQNLIYPEEALKNKIEGKVYVGVIIDTTGTPMCPIIVGKRLGYGCDEEAIRLVMKAKFTPAIMLHKKYIVTVVVAINFKLKNNR
jgi:TonB family protein